MPIKNHIGSQDISKSHNLQELESDTLLLQDQIKSECSSCYREVLEHMRPEQIVQGIKGFGFDTMKRSKIQKHPAWDLMIQLSCNILGEGTSIDSDHGKKTTQDIKDIQRTLLRIQVDGDAGPGFFSAVVTYIQGNRAQTNPQKNEQQVAETKPTEPLPPRGSEEVKSNESGKRTLDTLGGIRQDLANVCIKLFPKLEKAHKDRKKVTPQIVNFLKEFQRDDRITSIYLDDRTHLLFNENKPLTPGAYYTRVGQVSPAARTEGFKKWGISSPPKRNINSLEPTDIYNDLIASSGYYLAMGQSEIKYNLGPGGHVRLENIEKQAIDMLQKTLDIHNIYHITDWVEHAKSKGISRGKLVDNDNKDKDINKKLKKEYNTYIRDLIVENKDNLDQNLVAEAQASFYIGEIV